jgi:hypothetical protein
MPKTTSPFFDLDAQSSFSGIYEMADGFYYNFMPVAGLAEESTSDKKSRLLTPLLEFASKRVPTRDKF